jgi:protein-L-isoaspartate(D-aspartate) O-methyltransferase
VVNAVMIGDTIALRERMVHAQLMARGISDERVLKAMREVPREPFIPERYRDQAYSDQPLPIGWGQTISQPLSPREHERALEIGGGSGYSAAVMGPLVSEVVSVPAVEACRFG